MAQLLQFFVLIPFAGFFISLLLPRKNEQLLARTALITIGIHLAAAFIFAGYWLFNQHPVLDSKHAVLFKTPDFEIFIDFYFDKITMAFMLVGGVLSLLVAIFSRYYMHREEGFKRFFITLLFFYLGYNIIIFSGNFETLFVGWEILGLCSFLLIAFYRDRYLPVKNGLKIISIYRLSDICLILAMWMSHHFWHENITFIKLNDAALVAGHLSEHYGYGIFIAVLLLIAAAAKSAQLPFSSWLPRAMEGPTTSSAIFYGSLSVHLGVFILLRSFPFWSDMLIVKTAVIAIGLLTAFIASGIARVQSSVKTQVAYASIAQIGIIFIEVTLGLHTLALAHFAGNAFLRTYQLLVSPSVLSYLIHNQFYHFDPANKHSKAPRFKKIMYTLYMLNIKEWNMDTAMYRFLWAPFKWAGQKMKFIDSKAAGVFMGIAFLSGIVFFVLEELLPSRMYSVLPVVYAFFALVLILTAFAERGNAIKAWLMIFAGQFFIALAIALNQHADLSHTALYLCGGVVSAFTGWWCLKKIKSTGNDIALNGFHGHVYEQPLIALLFLLSCLGVLGFPITPSFIGIDVLFSHIGSQQYVLVGFIALCFVFIELSVMRMYARIFMGQHKKTYHPIAFRSS